MLFLFGGVVTVLVVISCLSCVSVVCSNCVEEIGVMFVWSDG